MKRILSIAGLAALAMSFGPSRAQAVEGPWCALISVGTGAVYEDCQYYSFAACQPNVLAGNRGFCNPNPRWTGEVVRPHAHHRRHARRD
ncbi:MAG TPA: DUF3551 domain-containing protein [Pseudolabrys sp.]|nr:DUF3551 domain-containing protein [Pseudolabrys sp.]